VRGRRMRTTEHAVTEPTHEQYLAEGRGRKDEALSSGPAGPHSPVLSHG